MIVRQLIAQATRQLADAGCGTPRLDAEVLLMHVWEINRTDLIIRSGNPVPDNVTSRFNLLLERRLQREPVAYLTGHKEFWSRDFMVDPRVLIPRPETEHLIEEVEQHYPDHAAPLRFCDIGTGSGCIAITLACEYPNAEIVATDISQDALAVARENAQKHGVLNRISFHQGDLLLALPADSKPLDVIISNPPYVSSNEMKELEPELSFEPQGALTDGKDGLFLLRQLLDQSNKWLSKGGLLMIETGCCGLPATPSHLEFLHSYSDLAGIPRGGVYCRI